MKDENFLRYTLRLNRKLFKEFEYIAEYNGRSANKEIEQLIKAHVKKFENANGKIEVPPEEVKSSEQSRNYRKK